MNWHKLTTDQANEIIALNKKKQKVASLEEYAVQLIEEVKSEYENVVGQDSLTRFDSPKRKNKRRNNRGKSKRKDNVTQSPQQNPQPKRQHKNRPAKPKDNNAK